MTLINNTIKHVDSINMTEHDHIMLHQSMFQSRQDIRLYEDDNMVAVNAGLHNDGSCGTY